MLQTICQILALGATVIASVMMFRALGTMLGTIRMGQPDSRTGNPVGRFLTMIKESLLHTRMLQWHWVGIMHWFVYAAFLILSSAVIAGFFQIFDPHFAIPLIGKFIVYEWVAEFIGLLGTVAIIFLIIYRQKNHPRSLGRKSRFFGSNFWQAYFVEFMVLIESAAILFIRGAEYKLLDDATPAHFPLSRFVSVIFPNGEHALELIIVMIATFKILAAMIWLMVIASNITMGVAWHRFTAWFNIYFKREEDGSTALGGLRPMMSGGEAINLEEMEDLDEDATLGVGQVEDFSWKGILDFTTCTECGRCQSQCPAWNTEKPLSPKLMIMGLREHAYAKAPYVRAGGEGSEAAAALLEKDPAVADAANRSLVGARSDENDWFYNPGGGDFVIDEDALWSCTSCGACVQQCPVDIEHVDHFVDMRRYQVLVESNFPAELSGLFKRMEQKGNPWGMSPNDRMDWAKGLDFDVKVVGEDIESLDEVEWLFWVGCAGAYEDRAKKTTAAVAELLNMAGVSFGVLGNGETCTGDSARRAGNEFVFQGLATQNAEMLKETKAKKVVSTCAHCFNTLRNEYAEFGVELEVVHHTQLLNRLVREKKLTPIAAPGGSRSITYHDPCYVGRHNQVYNPPRELLNVIPDADFKEMPRNSERSFCCGAGGARMWMEEKIGERININRTEEAVATGADQIAVGCPFCRVMLSDGLTAVQADGKARPEVEVLDVAQMLLASVKGEAPASSKPAEAPKAAPAAAAATATATKEAAPEAPAAKSDGGGSLFGDDSGGSSLFDDAPAEAPAAKSDGGGSLFDDNGGGGSLFDEAPAEAPAPPAAKSGDSGGSLFDVVEDAPAESAPAAPAAEAPAESLGGGSLFDIAEPEPEAPKPAATPEPAAEKAEAAPAAPEAPKAEEAPADSFGGSLFDVVEDAPAEAPATAAPAEPEAETPAVADPVPEAAPEPEATPEAQPEPAAEAEADAEPKKDISEAGSLFDL